MKNNLFIFLLLSLLLSSCAANEKIESSKEKSESENTEVPDSIIDKEKVDESIEIVNNSTDVDSAWVYVSGNNYKESLIAFVKKYRDSDYTSESIKKFKRHAIKKREYAIEEIQPVSKEPKTISKAKIIEDHGEGQIRVDGFVEHGLNPETGNFQNLFWNPGSQHTILCTFTFNNYTFLSDKNEPLIFVMTEDNGYVYQSGSGVVIEPNDKIILLGYQKNDNEASDAN